MCYCSWHPSGRLLNGSSAKMHTNDVVQIHLLLGAPYWRMKRALNMSNEETACNALCDVRTLAFLVYFHTTDYDYYFLWPDPCVGNAKLSSSRSRNPLSAALAVVVECRNNKNNNCTENHKADRMGILNCFSFSHSRCELSMLPKARREHLLGSPLHSFDFME